MINFGTTTSLQVGYTELDKIFYVFVVKQWKIWMPPFCGLTLRCLDTVYIQLLQNVDDSKLECFKQKKMKTV